MSATIPNRFPGQCAKCGQTVEAMQGKARAEGTRVNRRGITRTNWRTYHLHCLSDLFEPIPQPQEQNEMDEITAKIGYAPGSLPADAPLTGERRVAIRAYARKQGIPGEIVNSRMSADDLRALYNGSTTAAEMIRKYSAPEIAPTNETVSAPDETTANAAAELARILAKITSSKAAPLDETRVREIAREEAGSAPKRIEVTITGPQINKTLDAAPRHEAFPDALTIIGTGLNLYMPGPAGSGKTTIAEQIAQALELPFHFTGALDTQYALSGFIDAHGRCVHTGFRKAFEEGGVFLFDEIDASLPAPVLFANAALANGYCPFPDGMVKRHENFRCIAAANTFGHGADRLYVGRNQLDAASLDRFVYLPIGYDENLENLIAGKTDWTRHVQKVRRAVADLKLRFVISPRASLKGNALIAAGMPWRKVEELVLFGPMDTDTRAKVRAAI
jgi:cobaltochelatase CobS